MSSSYVSNSSVRVVVRIRPLLNEEKLINHNTNKLTIGLNKLNLNDSERLDTDSTNVDPSSTVHKYLQLQLNETSHNFQFDRVLYGSHKENSQENCYSAGNCDLILEKLIQGFNATIFAYGVKQLSTNKNEKLLYRNLRFIN